eukprot:scaffold12382_cov118-Isochrysis_galbana.AAC.3
MIHHDWRLRLTSGVHCVPTRNEDPTPPQRPVIPPTNKPRPVANCMLELARDISRGPYTTAPPPMPPCAHAPPWPCLVRLPNMLQL